MPEPEAVRISYGKLFALVMVVLGLVRVLVSAVFPLSSDEAYHWEWSRHPAAGYYDHPGMTAYVIWLSTHLFGRSTEFTVRLPALVLLTATAVVCYAFARFAAGTRGATGVQAERAGFLCGLMITVTPAFALLSVYMGTDPPLLFFGTAK